MTPRFVMDTTRAIEPLTWLLMRTSLDPNEIRPAGVFSGVLAAFLMSASHSYLGLPIKLLPILLESFFGEVGPARRVWSDDLLKLFLGAGPSLRGSDLGSHEQSS